MEYPVLILLNTIFLLIFISSYNLITLFLAIIGFSLNIYVLLLYDSFNHSSREAGIKYYYLSTFSSGLILGGILIAYLLFHTTSFLSIT
jgi:NADH:ubiquinone oxidoreductase subunit 2 (subunit N)